jgi:Mn-dependent DtxR family transcriptional regulator
MMTHDLSAVDLDVLRAIRVVRVEHHACTGTAVAGRLGFSKSYVFERIHALGSLELLEWNTMPGSLRLTDAGEALLDKLSAAPEVEGGPTETAPARRGRSHAS